MIHCLLWSNDVYRQRKAQAEDALCRRKAQAIILFQWARQGLSVSGAELAESQAFL